MKLKYVLFLSLACGGCVASPKQQPITQPDIPENTVITLERTACFGVCPTYTLTIFANGGVEFNGEYWSEDERGMSKKKTGPMRSAIGQDNVRRLISEFKRINFFALKDNYNFSSEKEDCPNASTDAPSAITSIRINEMSKTVDHYHGCKGTDTLEKLTAMESRIDEIVNTKQWLR